MKERGILFSAAMAKANVEGRKTMTRRAVKPQPVENEGMNCRRLTFYRPDGNPSGNVAIGTDAISWFSPYGVPGDRLWQRETIRAESIGMGQSAVRYLADNTWRSIDNTAEAADRWLDLYSYDEKRRGRGAVVPSIHMPRWACRLVLEITEVRIERLHDISEADALAEGIKVETVVLATHCEGGRHYEAMGERAFFDGCPDEGYEGAVDAYFALWAKINGQASLDANPWVWVVSYGALE